MTGICKLCDKNKELHKNSHVVPSFITASMLTTEGKVRDREVSSFISNTKLSNFYLGKELTSPEKAMEILERELTEHEIFNNKNPYIVEYFLCIDCEKKLGTLESYAAQNVYAKLNSFSEEIIDNKNYKTLSVEYYCALKLLFLSIIWRASITRNFASFFLEGVHEYRIKKILNDFITNNVGLVEGLKSTNIDEIPLLISFHNTSDNGNINSNLLNFYPYSKAPYYFTINEFICCYYGKPKSVNKSPKPYYGFEKLFDFKHIKRGISNGHVLLIDDANWKQILENTAKDAAKFSVKLYRKTFQDAYIKLMHKKPSEQEIQSFLNLLYNSGAILDKYSISHFAETLMLFFQGTKTD